MTSLAKELVESGIHFGQRRSNWNPKMGPFIHGTKNQIHIIDIKETIKSFNMIMNGEVDEYPEAAFNLVGTIEDAIEKGKKLLEEANA